MSKFEFDYRKSYPLEESILDTNIGELGVAYSETQVKLINLAKVLLAKPKLVLFEDEALQTDDLFESALFDVLTENTTDGAIMGILRDSNYINYFDKVLILQEGAIAEFENLENLIKNPNSLLSK